MLVVSLFKLVLDDDFEALTSRMSSDASLAVNAQ